jgi:hypothetical protein
MKRILSRSSAGLGAIPESPGDRSLQRMSMEMESIRSILRLR